MPRSRFSLHSILFLATLAVVGSGEQTAADAQTYVGGENPYTVDQPSTIFTQTGVYTIRQVSSGRYLDAYEKSKDDYAVVTRPPQGDATQLWRVSSSATYKDAVGQFWAVTMVQVSSNPRSSGPRDSSGRYLDAYRTQKDFGAVTRPLQQNNQSQFWIVRFGPNKDGKPMFIVQQFTARGSNRGYLDAYQSAGKDYRVVTREEQQGLSQHWFIERVGSY